GLRHHPEWIAGAEAYFQRYGTASLLVGRFIGPLRPMLPMVAGMCDMPFPRFIAVSLLAGAGWSVAYLLPGWATGAAIRLPLPEGFWTQAGIVAGSIAVMVGLSATSSLRQHRRATALIAGMSFLILTGLFIGYPHLGALDQGLMTLVQEHRNSMLDEVAVVFTLIGEFRNMLLFSVLLTGLLLLMRQWRPAIFTASTLLCTALANTATKYLFARMRPEVLSDPLTSYSMPSGHASGSFALFLALAVLAGRGQPPRMRLTWLLVGCLPATAIALSRVYLGAHWPTDVLAGAMLAACVCAASLWLIQRKEPLNALPPKVWWLVLPALLALFGFFVLRHLPHTMLRYAY
ncbi:MAG: bifunctional DedA family/phosphatase PAP2 family protein, partial [Pseudomonas fluorescens]|nr:bifunctional DedA family/phosphatase PAP2 family protein [Pseudomonas fluorescens]